MVAAFGNLQIAVMPRGQLHVRLRDQVDEGALAGRCGFVHGLDDRLVLVRTGHSEDLREAGADRLSLFAHAAGDDHAAILGDRLADRGQALFLGGIEEAARIDQHDIGPGIVGAHRIAIGAQPGEDPLGIDQRLRTAKADHTHALLVGKFDCHGGGPLHCTAPKC